MRQYRIFIGRQTTGALGGKTRGDGAVRQSGLTTVAVSRRLGITQSAVAKAIYRGEKLAKDKGF